METETSCKSEQGLELSAVDWLLDHHRAKELHRRQMVEDLDLRPGDLVLDSACGPGLWARLFAQKVGPDGCVVGLDFAPGLIRHAEESLRDDPLGRVIALALGDFHELPFHEEAFDAVFLGNCFCYVDDVPPVLDAHRRVTKPGGRVISKEFDGAAVIFHPLDPYLTLRVLGATARALKEDSGAPTFDNFVGRKMNGLFRQVGFADVATRSYAIQKVSPLTPEEKRYVTANARWYGDRAAPFLSDADHLQWQAAFDANSPDYVLDCPEFYFCMIEMVTVGRVTG